MECRDYLAFSQKLTKMTCPVHPLFATTLSPPWRYAQASFCSVCRFLHIIFQSLFQSLKPYHDTSGTIPASLCRLKMAEGIYALLNTDRRFFITLFGDIIYGNLDILDILNESIGNEMSWRAIKNSKI